jgi:hypothetical protein
MELEQIKYACSCSITSITMKLFIIIKRIKFIYKYQLHY